MDGFCEQVVQRKNGAKQRVIIALIITAFLFSMLFFMFLTLISGEVFWSYYSLILGIVGALVAWRVFPKINRVEYDYEVVGNTLRISKVTAKSSRKGKLKTEIKNIERLERLTDDNEPDGRFVKTYDFSGRVKDEKLYFVQFRDSARGGVCLLIFSPNEKILEGMRPFLRREIVKKLFFGR